MEFKYVKYLVIALAILILFKHGAPKFSGFAEVGGVL